MKRPVFLFKVCRPIALKPIVTIFPVLHFQVCITKELRYFVMRYHALSPQLSKPCFFPVVVLQRCRECFV